MILSRTFIRRGHKGYIYLFRICAILTILLSHSILLSSHRVPQYRKLLKDIHDEVMQLGIDEDPDLIEKEFWMDLDGQEGNKEEHVVVMRYNDGLNLKMTVQITYFSEDKGKRYVRFAKDTKLVQCCIKEHDLEIDHSDYSDKEMDKLFKNILIGIRKKKELLKLIKQYI
jgi:hypothetical protein